MSSAAASPDSGKSTPTVHWPILNGLLIGAVLTLAAFLASFAATNADLWLRLASGRLIAAGQYPFGLDPFSAFPNTPWINHSWLFDLALYVGYQRAGGAALVAGKAVLLVALAAVLISIRRPKSDSFGPVVATTLVLLAMIPLLALRSTVASFLLFAVLLLLLHRCRQATSSWRLPASVGVLFLIWVNVDSGFVLGLALLLLYGIGSVLQRILPLGEPNESRNGLEPTPTSLGISLVVAVIACLINPYFFRAFGLPNELIPWSLPDEVMRELARERLFEALFRSPFSEVYPDQIAGWFAGIAFYILLGAGLLSFAVNASGWHWARVLSWGFFAWLGSSYWRLIPYFALVGGPVLVLNLQETLARRQARRTSAPAPQVMHFMAFLGGFSRIVGLIGLLVLLALAWPGWLGADARRSANPIRRVAWRAEPEPTQTKLALQLADWYKAGKLPQSDSRGFHLNPDFPNYCAWFCPDEKSLFDTRFTAPPAATVDYLNTRRAILAASRPRKPDEDQPDIDSRARSLRVNHIVANGADVILSTSAFAGVAPLLLNNSQRWPLWAIAGQGLICGWREPNDRTRDPLAALHIAPLPMAVGDQVRPLPPAPADFPRPTEISAWDRFRSALPPIPPDTYEAGLWLTYRTSLVNRRVVPFYLIQLFSAFERTAPVGVSDIALQILKRQPGVEQGWTAGLELPWQRSPDGRLARSATLLAIRAARRAILANPDQPGAYAWLARAYSEFESDPQIRSFQQLTAARQALTRIAVLPPERRPDPVEELQLQAMLLDFYQRSAIPGTRIEAKDLLFEAFERVVDLEAKTLSPAAGGPELSSQDVKNLETYMRGRQQQISELKSKLQAARDECENASKLPLVQRLTVAISNGLVREAVTMLRNSDPNERDLGAVLTLVDLLLFEGEAEDAHDILQSDALKSIDQLPDAVKSQATAQIRSLKFRTAACLGDYATGIVEANELVKLHEHLGADAIAGVLADLVMADINPMHPLTRALTLPSWAGLREKNGQPAVVNRRALLGSFVPMIQNEMQLGDVLVRRGLLALEAGDIQTARQSFERAAGPSGPRVFFSDRGLAYLWLELLASEPKR